MDTVEPSFNAAGARSAGSLWLAWLLACSLGGALGAGVADLIVTLLENSTTLTPPEYMLYAIIGVVIALAQWMVLRRRIPRAGWWILASLAGWAGGSFISSAALGALEEFGLLPAILTYPVSFTILGAAVGLLQWAVLPPGLPGAGWWVVGNGVGWALGWPVVLGVDWAVKATIPESASFALSFLLFGATAGLVTGLLLTYLMRGSAAQIAP